MPTYNYRCTKCEKIFDAFHSMMCTDPQHCPECGAAGTKLLSASSIIFKGSGFYSTDYRDSGYIEAKKKDGSTGTTAPATTETAATPAAEPAKSDAAAPAAKAEPASAAKTATPAATTSTPVAQAA
ncbi:MAG TPA: zinc ribbon domain-containing protein [Candidatus Rifleibacterium sp.]|nr:zinc ribbon domain-containing protein [Candidatus Rifleibacterium sp.]